MLVHGMLRIGTCRRTYDARDRSWHRARAYGAGTSRPQHRQYTMNSNGTSRRAHATTIVAVKRGEPGRHGRRRPSHHRRRRAQARRAQAAHTFDGQVIAGFAGAVADALTLFTKFESQLECVGWQPAQGRCGAHQGVAHRPLPAASRSPADCGRSRITPAALGRRRCDRAR